jgi:hypothetical protein
MPPQNAAQPPDEPRWWTGTSSGRIAPIGAQNMQFAIWKETRNSLFSSFPYVCPEPVLVK